MENLKFIDPKEKEQKINDPKYKKQIEARNIVQKILELGIKEDQKKMIIQFLALELSDIDACKDIYNILKIDSSVEEKKQTTKEKKGSILL